MVLDQDIQGSDPFALWKEVLGVLSEKEGKVIKHRFGIGDIEPQTLEQVGNVMGVTRERIRQIEAKALRKLRQKAHAVDLKVEDYL